jgi:hypothetical protein
MIVTPDNAPLTRSQVLKERTRLSEAVDGGATLVWRRTPLVQWKIINDHDKIATCDVQNLALEGEVELGPIWKYRTSNGLIFDSIEEAEDSGSKSIIRPFEIWKSQLVQIIT